MPDFSKGSTFNKDANFQGVKFGADAPLLETELNELQDIQTEARADIIRDTIPSGFVQLGELDYDYMLNNENCVKLKTDSVAYVNGYKINIPKDTLINIGKAPEKEAREDLVFLEVWKEEVSKDSKLTKFGGEGQVEIANGLLDDRMGQETSRRVALKWRIRHIPNLNPHFNEDCITNVGYGWSTSYSYYPKLVTGGNSELLDFDTTSATTKYNSGFVKANNSNANIYATHLLGDSGLFVCGTGTDSAKTRLKTLDGYVYAIPMFKLYRKPSCGKAIPFEYQKIHPKTDFTRFNTLVKDERVEKVVWENVTGNTVLNVLDPSIIQARLTGVTLQDDGYLVLPNGQQDFNKSIPITNVALKPNTKYTLIRELNKPLPGSMEAIGFHLTEAYYQAFLPVGQSEENAFNDKTKAGMTKVLLTTKPDLTSETNLFLISIVASLQDGVKFRLRLLEGDWMNKEVPSTFFVGLKSLGESEGNNICVKNSILNESSYDPKANSGNITVNMLQGTNHLGCENTIQPTFRSQMIIGEPSKENVPQTVSSFGKLDSLTGDEKLTFVDIKGKTLQNVSKSRIYSGGSCALNINQTSTEFTATATSSGSAVLVNECLLKDNTTYTIMIDYMSNQATLNVSFLKGNNFTESLKNISVGALNVYKKLIFTLTTTTNNTALVIGHHGGLSSGALLSLKKNIIILEGDYSSDVMLKQSYFSDIVSVGDYENNKVLLKRTGKNLLGYKNYLGDFEDSIVKMTYDKDNDTLTLLNKTSNIEAYKGAFHVNLKPNTSYTLSYESTNNLNEVYVYKLGASSPFVGTTNKSFSFNTGDSCDFTIRFDVNGANASITYFNIQLEEGTSKTSYDKYKEYRQEITLKEPLRSLPNGVCDYIKGNKVVRRVGVLVLNGNQYTAQFGNKTDSHIAFDINVKTYNPVASWGKWNNTICDKFLSRDVYNNDVPGYYFETASNLRFKVSLSSLATQDAQGMKTWFAQNPTTIYYELANPTEEPIEPNYDKESIKTYQLDAPLRSLPNGVKDEIVGNKLIRRCGEVILNGTENWDFYKRNTGVTFSNTIAFETNKISGLVVNDNKDNLNIYCTGFKPHSFFSVDEEGIFTKGMLRIAIANSKLTTLDVATFKAWLSQNPVKVIYELASPVEIPLKEVHSNTSNFTLQRQFSDGNYLRELPNGVKDTIENGKVIRRVKNIVLTGSESWVDSTRTDYHTNVRRFELSLSESAGSISMISNLFVANSTSLVDFECIFIGGSNAQVLYVNINSNKLPVQDVNGFKNWLSKNHMMLLYELKTPTEEALSADNFMPYPCHEINTYCGSLYVGNGTNDAFVNNELNTDSVVIDTNFRSISNKAIITDCKYKKHVDGYDTLFTLAKGKNRISKSMYTNTWISPNNYGDLNDSTGLHYSIYYIPVEPNKSYILTSDKTLNRGTAKWLDMNKNFISGFSLIGSSVTGYKQAKTTVAPPNTFYLCIYVISSGNLTTDNYNIQLEEGEIATEYETYEPTQRAFENIESNNIDDLRHLVSLTGFNYEQILNESFDKLLRGEL